eukprot:TRINITY_DN13743_c0_g1_i1.p1 TRINITY_DN13743_c0_g1~~TRINITY_DN13743_c0_g1_i1.p1  ORF type:complete len:150 (+),score=100.97 TRINITY_DN13743_c0_g1_i1:15-464(+)
MIRRPPRSTQGVSSAASDVYKRQSIQQMPKGVKDTKKPAPARSKGIKKDKNAPKKPMTAYFWYMKTRREDLKKEKPDLNHKEIISTMAEEWRSMTEDKKAKYNKMAEEDKAKAKKAQKGQESGDESSGCLLYTSPSPRDLSTSRMPSSA